LVWGLKKENTKKCRVVQLKSQLPMGSFVGRAGDPQHHNEKKSCKVFERKSGSHRGQTLCKTVEKGGGRWVWAKGRPERGKKDCVKSKDRGKAKKTKGRSVVKKESQPAKKLRKKNTVSGPNKRWY